MKFRIAGLIVSAVALAAFAAPSVAHELKPKRPAHVHYFAAKSAKPDLFTGAVPNVGSDNRYFSDTRETPVTSLGATFFQRYDR